MRSSAEWFFRKALKSSHNQEPRIITVDKNAAYPPGIDELKKDQPLPKTTELRPGRVGRGIAAPLPPRNRACKVSKHPA
jgi:transposase-like protein